MFLARSHHVGGVRFASTLVGRSGREYVRGKILKRRSETTRLQCLPRAVSKLISTLCFDPNAHPGSRSGNQSFVLKGTSESVVELAMDLKREFPDTRRLRVHIDESVEENVLVYEYFNDDLLSFIKRNQNLPIGARKWILRELGESLKELHAKNWIHIGKQRQSTWR